MKKENPHIDNKTSNMSINSSGLPSKKKIGNLTLFSLFDSKQIQTIHDSFARATNVASIIIDPEGNPITRPCNFTRICEIVQRTELGKQRCAMSDLTRNEIARNKSKPVYHACTSCGFVDGSLPIIVGEEHVGDWLIGQCNASDVSDKFILRYAAEIGADKQEMLKAFRNMPRMSLKKFEHVMDFLWTFITELIGLKYENYLTNKKHAELTAELNSLLPGADLSPRLAPVCSVCKKIRNKEENWQSFELYFQDRYGAEFSHTLCPDCLGIVYDDD
jgi:ligand-binding sensor protein